MLLKQEGITVVAASVDSAEDTATFLHATGFLLHPDGHVVNAVYSTGPIGRFTANDVLKKVVFEKRMAERASR